MIPPPRTLRVALEHHFVEVDGRYYTDISYDYTYWKQFLDVFDAVVVVGRVRSAREVPASFVSADGRGVRFHPVYDYLGLWRFLRHLPRVWRDCGEAMREPSPVLLRMGVVSLVCWLHLRRAGRPYAMEVLFHAGDVARGVRNIQILGLARFVAWALHRVCRMQAAGASLASHVSGHLAELYPTRSGRHWLISDVYLPDGAFADARPADRFRHEPIRLIAVGRVAPEKGQDVLLRALARVRSAGGPAVTLDVVGPGAIEEMCRLAEALGVGHAIRFHGAVPVGEPVRGLLDRADLFVLPSRTEGMPRALLEAEARGLPAVATRVGGVPSVLTGECLVPAGDPDALASKIAQLIADPDRLARLSEAGVSTARGFHYDILGRRRSEFWRALAELGGSVASAFPRTVE